MSAPGTWETERLEVFRRLDTLGGQSDRVAADVARLLERGHAERIAVLESSAPDVKAVVERISSLEASVLADTRARNLVRWILGILVTLAIATVGLLVQLASSGLDSRLEAIERRLEQLEGESR